jgi:hypothetical protein
MRWMVMSLLLLGLGASAGEKPTEIDLRPSKTFTLTVELWHSLTGERLTQEIDVAEGETFRLTTTSHGVRWTLKGMVGKAAADVVPVELTTEYFRSEKYNLRSWTRFDLNLREAKQPSVGGVHGVFVTPSIRRNRLR